jgi:hypothetical protein
MENNYSINIVSAERLTIQEDNSQIISVQFEILNGEEVVTTLRHGFPLEATTEDISEDLGKVLATFLDDLAGSEKNAAIDKATEAAEETIVKIKGLKITSK